MLRESESAKGENSLVCCDIFSTTLSDTWLLHQSSKLERVYLKWHENRRSYQTYFFSPFVPKPSLPHKVDCSPEGWPLRAGDEKVFLLLLIASVCSRNNSSNRVLLFHFFSRLFGLVNCCACTRWRWSFFFPFFGGNGEDHEFYNSSQSSVLREQPERFEERSQGNLFVAGKKKFRGLRQLISPFSGGSFSLCSLPVFEFRQLCMSS